MSVIKRKDIESISHLYAIGAAENILNSHKIHRNAEKNRSQNAND